MTVLDRRLSRRGAALRLRRPRDSESGFTLVELVIVVGITPLIIGALAIALISVFSLQTSVANRLTDTGQAQSFQSTFRIDVESAEQITTEGIDVGGQCGPGTQLLGLEWNENGGTHVYQTVVSYMSVAQTVGSNTTYSLVRKSCTSGPSSTPTTSLTIASDLSSSDTVPTVTCATGDTCDVVHGWVVAQNIESVTFPVTETSSNDSLTLVADPATSASSSAGGSPIAVTTSTGCGYADANSGVWSTALCLIDFTSLTGNNLLAAEQGCLETSVPLPGHSTMYYCIGLSGETVSPAGLPTWTGGFLGNTLNGAPFYTDIPGDPAIYQDGSGTTTITISGIEVLGSNGNPDSGWEFISADAESTDDNESINWTTNSAAPMTIIPNDESVDTPTDPIGNACDYGANVTPQSVLTGASSNSITCGGDSLTPKTGTVMVQALTPTSMTVKMVGNGREAVSFGLLF